MALSSLKKQALTSAWGHNCLSAARRACIPGPRDAGACIPCPGDAGANLKKRGSLHVSKNSDSKFALKGTPPFTGGTKERELNRRYFIVGERRISSFFWASVIFLGGLGFLLTGISSYLKYNLFSSFYRLIQGVSDFSQNTQLRSPSNLNEAFDPTSLLGGGAPLILGGESLVFFPQGLLMCFYGSLGLLLSLYFFLNIYWNVGGGFNEFNKREGFMRIFRWGYPGKNRRIDLVYSLKDIEAIRVDLSTQAIFVRLSTGRLGATSTPSEGKLKEKRELPLGGVGEPLTLKKIEKQASELAIFLQVPLEGL